GFVDTEPVADGRLGFQAHSPRQLFIDQQPGTAAVKARTAAANDQVMGPYNGLGFVTLSSLGLSTPDHQYNYTTNVWQTRSCVDDLGAWDGNESSGTSPVKSVPDTWRLAAAFAQSFHHRAFDGLAADALFALETQ